MIVDLQAATDEMDRRARRNNRLAANGDAIEKALYAWLIAGNVLDREDPEGDMYATAAHTLCEVIERAFNG